MATPLLALGRTLLLWALLLPQLYAQQVRVAHINHDKFPQVSVTLEINGVADAPTRDDFTVKAGDRPFPFELILQKESGNAQAPTREVLLVLDAGPWSSGNRILEMKKALLQILERAPAGTAFAFGWYKPAAPGESLFVGSQAATTDIDLLREAIQRVYSAGDTMQPMPPALALQQAVEWFTASKTEALREVVVVTTAGGVALGEQPLAELGQLLEEKQLRLHIAFYKAEREAVADQLRELAARSRGKTPNASNVAALQLALTGILGIAEGTKAGKRLEDYAIIVRFESDEREDGTAREAVIRYRGQEIPVSYLAASAQFEEGNQTLLDRITIPLLIGAGGLMALLLFISILRRQQRLRRELKAERERVVRAESRMQAQLAADQTARNRLATNVQIADAPAKPPTAGVPSRLVAQLNGQDFTFLLTGNVLTIGRSPDNDITLGHATVSNRHALLQLRDGLWWVSDLDSTNGIRVNNHLTHETSLAVGDTLHIGEVALQLLA